MTKVVMHSMIVANTAEIPSGAAGLLAELVVGYYSPWIDSGSFWHFRRAIKHL